MMQIKAALLLLLEGSTAIAQQASSPLLPKHIVCLKYPRLANFAHISDEVSLEAEIASSSASVDMTINTDTHPGYPHGLGAMAFDLQVLQPNTSREETNSPNPTV